MFIMEHNDNVAGFRQKVYNDLYTFLVNKGTIDSHLPECPDVQNKWEAIAGTYIPDGAREFRQYPVVSLAWMMFMGIAMAFYWDTDWENQAAKDDQYQRLRDHSGYDNLDDTILHHLLAYDDKRAEVTSDLVAECAARVLSLLNHEQVEPGTPAAFHCYVDALHEMYIMGMAIELHDLGYHMTPVSSLN